MTSKYEIVNNESLTFPPPSTIILTNLVNQLLADDQFYIEALKLARKFGYSAVYQRKVIVNPDKPNVLRKDFTSGNNDLLKGKVVWIPDLEDTVKFTEQETDIEENTSRKPSYPTVPLWTEGRKLAYLRSNKRSRQHKKITESESKQGKLIQKIKINVNKNKSMVLQHESRNSDVTHDSIDVPEDVAKTADKSEQSSVDFDKQPANLCYIKPCDYELFPIFKNYKEGSPSNKLYIKNLSKNVDLEDLHNLYRQFASSNSEFSTDISIRFFNTGKLRRQAFVTFPNIKIASKACRTTNGTMLKGKPIYVVFARNSTDK